MVRSSLLLLVIALIVGCAGDPFAPLPMMTESPRYTTRVAPTRVPITLPADPTVEDYVALAMERNPRIVAAREKAARLRESVTIAGSLDDPMFSVTPIGEMAETAAGEVGLTATISQKLPTPGKLSTRGRIAAQEAAAAEAVIEESRLAIATQTRQAYWSYYFAVRAMEVTRESRALLDQFRQIAQARLETGAAAQQEVLKASVELSGLDQQIITFEQSRQTARAMLNRMMDRSTDAPLPEPVAATLRSVDVRLDELIVRADQNNPAIKSLHEQIEAARQRVRLARLDRWPDLTVAANYAAVDDRGLSPVANGDDQWSIGLGVNLPIWSGKNDAAERAAMRGLHERIAMLSDTRNTIAFRINDALSRVQTQQRLVELFKQRIIPEAAQTVDASFADYRAGRSGFLALIDDWRKRIEFELMYHRSLAQLERDFADLQEAVGTAIGR